MDSTGQRATNRMKRDLAAGKACLGATITFHSPVVAEIMSRVGFDWLWFDTEHTALTLDNVATMLQATNGADVSTVIRVPWNDRTMIKRALDIGPDGILVPVVNSREEAEAAVTAMKYPPWGERGAGLGRAQAYGMHMAEYLRTADDEVMTIVQIEHVKAVDNIDEIVAVKGVDAAFVGALDLSGSMGLLGQTDHPQVEKAVQTVLAACRKAGVSCGIVAIGPDQANRRIGEGFTCPIVGIDVLYLHGSAHAALSEVKR